MQNRNNPSGVWEGQIPHPPWQERISAETHKLDFMTILSHTENLRTPFYHYDSALLSRTLEAISSAIADSPSFHVHYAVKACATPSVLSRISAAGFGADCVSGGEIVRAVEQGFRPSDIVFAGVGKSDWEIRTALECGIAAFNVESVEELDVINAIALEMGKVAPVALRINPNVDAHTHEKITTGLNENKFGIAAEAMLSVIRRTQSLEGVRFVGLHFHIGSQITTFGPFEALCHRINALTDTLRREGISVRTLNVGGGLGIDYDYPEAHPIPDFESYFSTFKRLLHLEPGQELHFELGRAVVAQCGSLVSRVLYVKKGVDKHFVIVDAGMTDLVRPAMYGSFHKPENLTAAVRGESSEETYDIVGPICESSDVFVKGYRMPRAQRGDIIVFRSAGAYGEVMASQYNCRPLPGSVMD